MKSFATTAFLLVLAWNQAVRAEPFILSGPPLETADRGYSAYRPIADFLTEKTGERFVHYAASSWLSYVKAMRNGDYDIVFDEPHFVAWRAAALSHVPLIRLPGALDFVVISRSDDDDIVKLSDLAGHKVCAGAPHDLGTLVMQLQFANPVRQPQIQSISGTESMFNGLMRGLCRGAVMSTTAYKTYKDGRRKSRVRILHLSEPLPNWALTAGPRIPALLQETIRTALLSPDGVVATAALREAFPGHGQWLATGKEEYQDFAGLLHPFYGFSR